MTGNEDMRMRNIIILSILCLSHFTGFIGGFESPDIEQCPKPQEEMTPCIDNKRTLTRVYYKIQSGKCKRHYSHETTACGDAVEKKCPLVRFVSFGKCREGFQKTLVVRYKWNPEDGTCRKHGEFIGQVCDKKLQDLMEAANSTCPVPVYFEKPCSMDLRPVFTIFYEMVDGNCTKRIRYASEPCAMFDNKHKCPEREMKTKGPCDAKGFQYVLWKTYRFNEEQKCLPINKMTYEMCNLDEGCPKPRVMKTFNECVNGERHVLESESVMFKGKCKTNLVIKFEPCGESLIGHCSKTRYVQKGVCEENGKRKFMITHYEKGVDKICRRKKSFVIRPCDMKDPYESQVGCPPAKYRQFECKGDYRRVLRNYYAKDHNQHCHMHTELSYEPCRDTMENNECPYKDHESRGPCMDGFLTVTTYSYTQDDSGCHEHTVKTHFPCNSTPL